jgi:hypothetical protein
MQMDLCCTRKQENKCYIVRRAPEGDYGQRVFAGRCAVASAVEPGRG